MVDQIVASEDVYVFGQPSSIEVNISTGPQGDRGTYIFQGPGKPTDPDITFLDNSSGQAKTIQPLDMYINIKPSDDEYLYLYQYEQTITGTYQWVKTLRLVPNTAIGNIPVVFYAGRAISPVISETYSPTDPELPTAAEIIGDIDTYLSDIIPSPTQPGSATKGDIWLNISVAPQILKIYDGSAWILLGTVFDGYSFILNNYFPLLISEGATVTSTSFNIQYSIIENNGETTNTSPKPIASTISVGDIAEVGTDVTLPIYVSAIEATTTYSELGVPSISWLPLTGTKLVHVIITAGIGA